MLYFPPLRSKCQFCKREISHLHGEAKSDHMTCIEYLLDFSSVCCAVGFKNLLENEKELIQFVKKAPMLTNRSKIMQIAYVTPLFIDETLMNECKMYLQNQSNVNHQHHLDSSDHETLHFEQ